VILDLSRGTIKDSEGNRVDGVHLFLGGKITKEAKEARILHRSSPNHRGKISCKVSTRGLC